MGHTVELESQSSLTDKEELKDYDCLVGPFTNDSGGTACYTAEKN